jgi:hypothetical protein
MRRETRIAVGIAAAIGVAAIGISVLGPFMSDCLTQRFSSVASPSGKKLAEYYQTVCKSDGGTKAEIHLVQDGARVRTEIGQAGNDEIGLAWKDEHLLVITVPPGMEKAFNRRMQGVDLEFRVANDAARLK